jgi:4-aminobutyrate aminotransferase-like enzyme
MMLSLILLLGKGMGGGMPVGALPHQPKWWIYWVIIQNWDISPLGHPVIASACLATLQEITETDLMDRL